LYQISYNLTQTKKTIQANANSTAIQNLNTQYNNMINDITLTTDTSLGDNSLASITTELRGWSDSNANKYQKGCTPAAMDAYSQTTTGCPTGYTSVANGAGALGTQDCLLYKDFTNSGTVSSRYSSMTGCQNSGSNDFSSVAQAVSAYVNALNTYITDNQKLITELINNNSNLNTEFVKMANKLSVSLDNVSGVINPLVTEFQSILGSNGLFQLVNCGIDYILIFFRVHEI
jgi:hypothetical protein